MKKLLLLCALLLVIISTNAQEHAFAFLLGSDSVNVNLDYSRMKINGVSQETFSALLEKDHQVWQSLFEKELNDSNEQWNIVFGNFPNARYTLLVQFISSEKNAALRAMFRIVDMQTVSEHCAQVVSCRGGLYGSFEELFGESVERMGEEIGDIIKDNMD